MTTNPTARSKALRATRAVTLGGLAFVAACGTSPEPVPDAGNDGGTDTSPDVTSDVTVDSEPDIHVPVCSTTEDGLCPEGCDRDNDIDCCFDPAWGGPDWCTFDASWGCSCAVEGPFAPPQHF